MGLLMSVFSSNMYAWNYTGTGPWANVTYGNWTVYEDGYGSQNDQSQTLYANSAGNFACYVNYSGGGTKNYAHTQSDVDIPISSSYYCNSNFNFSAPNNYYWSFFYDVWTANMQDELMIQEAWNNDGATWGTKIANNVNIAGRMISSVWHANNGANDVYIFTPSTQRTSGSDDIMAYFIWCQGQGLLHNNTLHQVSFGVEVTYTSGWQQFTVNSFSASWGSNGSGGSSNMTIQNKATGLYIDGMGRTSNGSNAGQWSYTGSSNQQWAMEASGSNVKFKNIATGLYLDGMGRNSNGSLAGQWSSSGINQQWILETNGNYKKIKNAATGLYLDGMYWSSNGSDLGQWSNSGSDAQQWSIATLKSASASEGEINSPDESDKILLYPNPFLSEINITINKPDEINRVVIFDLAGKQVEAIEKLAITNPLVTGSSLQSGMYIVRIYGTKKTESYQIVKK